MAFHPTRFLLLTGLAAGLWSAAPAALPPPARDFRTFTGVCQGAGSAALIGQFTGWDREDLSWNKFEPKPGEWNQAELERWGARVLELKERGIRFLPILCYSATWAVDLTPRVAYESDDSRIELRRNEDGEFIKVVHKKAHNGSWVRESAAKVKPRVQWALAADQVPAWEAYVRRIVAFLSAPPYSVEYFQIWNEAHPASSFWELASMDDYMQRIHLPAAKIIREHGAKVVYGGWPDCGALKDYVALLDRHDAWRTIDVHDIHYFPLSAFDFIQKAARERGLGTVPLWQTEIGFVRNTGTIPNTWPRFLAWSLRNEWNQPDKYKLFWFPAWTPDAEKSYGYGRALLHGSNLSAHGRAMQTLAELFSPGDLALHAGQVVSRPALTAASGKDSSSMEVFRIGAKRIVAAIHLEREKDDPGFSGWTGATESDAVGAKRPLFDLRFEGLRSADIKRIRRVDMAGGSLPLEPFDPRDARGTTLRIPVTDPAGSPAAEAFRNASPHTFFVEIELN